MTLVAYVFWTLQTVKCMVRQIFKQSCFIAPFYGQHVNGSQTFVKSPPECFYIIILSLRGKLTSKNSLFLIFELLRLFVKILTPDDKYSVCNIWNLQELYQMHLSNKLRTLCKFFSPFFKSASNFQHFEKKDDSHSLCISGITDCERHGSTNVQIAPFKSTLPQSTCQSVPKSYEICMTALLSFFFFLIPRSREDLENISVSDMLTLRALF